MSFIWPAMLLLLLLIPLSAGLYIRIYRRRQRNVANFGGLGSTPRLTGRQPGIRRHIPPVLFLAGLTTLMIAMARPQAVISLPKIQGTVMLAFDVSGSMAATDLKPSRIEAAKTAARDFVQRQPSGVQIGIVAFSDNGFAVQVPTNDQDAILAAINRLTPQRGTSLANGVLASLNAIAVGQASGGNQGETQGEPAHLSNQTPTPTPSPTPMPKGTYTPAVIVLLTDGENNESPDPMAVAQTASNRGVRIYTVGIGSAAGTLLHINGFTVRTRLYEDVLKQIAQITGGTYYNAENEQDLRTIYDHLDPQLVIKPEKTEVTAIFAGASILVFLIGGLFSLVWFNRLP